MLWQPAEVQTLWRHAGFLGSGTPCTALRNAKGSSDPIGMIYAKGLEAGKCQGVSFKDDLRGPLCGRGYVRVCVCTWVRLCVCECVRTVRVCVRVCKRVCVYVRVCGVCVRECVSM